jgi:methylthioribose-1-phosphate isomerase
VCANGDTVAPLGSIGIARIAREAGRPVYAIAPSLVVDPQTPDRDAVTTGMRSPAQQSGGARLDPLADIVPADLLTGILPTEG